ncbi:MAG TPA: hypothetical protein VJO13_20760 [Ktedonobacterales bacterium]|nr:hypothetical protein [Ktedonobacterales bacterium]
MPHTDPRYDALRERFSDILSETEDDSALTRLVHDLDAYMSVPVSAPLSAPRQQSIGDANLAEATGSHHTDRPHSHGIPPRRLSLWLGTVAAALVVALLAGMLLTRMHAPLGQTTNGGHGNFSPAKGACAPGDITAHLPKDGEFSALEMVSPDEGWALGAVTDPANGISESSLILHYKNCAWTALPTSYQGVGLSSISMGSASDGWAIGSTTSGAPFAMHYANGVWKQVTPPGADILHGLFAYRDVHMLSADEGWLGVNLEKDSQGNPTSALLHFTNGKWSRVDTPFAVISTVLPVAPADAWVVGYATNTAPSPDMYHYQAGTWTKTAAPPGISIFTLRMVSPNDIWASGLVGPGSSGTRTIEAAVAHYDGSQWRQVAVSASGNPEDVEAFDQNTSWAFTKYDPSVTTGNAPPPNNPPTIVSAQYQHGNAWQHVAWPFTNLSLIGSLTRVSADEYWAIGYYYVTHQTPTGNGGYTGSGYAVGVLLYFANGAWHEIPTQ